MNKIIFGILLLITPLHGVFSQTCDFIYVSTTGNNGNPGTEDLPVQTLSQAITLISGTRTNIRMAGGLYTETGIVTMGNNVHIDGAYSVVGNVWTKSTAQITSITFSGIEIVSGVRHRIGFKADGVSDWSLTDLTIITTAITGADPSGRGSSNYAVWINNCSNYTVSRCDITVGNASPGTVGVNGANGANGSPGSQGGSGSCDGNYSCCFGSETAPGGIGGAGGNGAIGVLGGAANSGTSATNPGTAGTLRNGGGGGAGGKGGGFSGGNNAVNGSAGGGSASTPMNTAVGTAGGQGDPGGDGTNAGNGISGAVGSIGTVGPAGTHVTGYFIPGAQAGTGADGAGGQGGAGGGGGGRQVCSLCDDGPGNGGGGGGGGGQGGQGGTGGRGGGGSFAIYATASNAGAAIEQNTLIAGAPGAGGLGGNGGNGGGGGAGGPRRTTCSSEIGEGGAGGNGGAGGAGGNGGTGAFGLSAQLTTDGVVSSPSVTIPMTPALTTNFGGCTNSEVIITKGSGTWDLQPTSLFISDLNDASSSYTTASANAIVSYSSTGFKNLVNDVTTYTNFIHIVTDRPLPTFDASMTNTACEGSSFMMSTPTTGVEFEWVVFLTSGNTTAPLATFNTSAASWPTPITGGSENYSVRLRVRDECCGWSAPVYYDFTVTLGPSQTDVIAACESYSWIDGNTYAASTNTPMLVVPGAAIDGCDSIYYLNLTISQPQTAIDVVSSCETYVWMDGNAYSSNNNTATYTIPGAATNGCDSVYTLNLTILNASTGIDVQTACESYTWIDGNTYAASTNTPVYTLIGGAANGCDSIVTLNLTIGGVSSSSYNNVSCNSHTLPSGTEIYYSGVYYDTLQSVNGCDSTFVVYATIHNVDTAVTQNGNTLIASASQATIQWINCSTGMNVPGYVGNIFQAPYNGTFAAVIFQNGCYDTTACYVISTLDIADEDAYFKDVRIYPNPTHDKITIEIPETMELDEIELMDNTGRVVQVIVEINSVTHVDLSSLESGLYYVLIKSPTSGMKSIPVVKN